MMSTATTSHRRGVLLAALALVAVAGSASACSSSASSGGGGSSSGGGSGVFTVWDPYPQFDGSSGWVGLLEGCGRGVGVSVRRTAFDTTDLTSRVLLAAQQGAAPDVLVVDNPVVSTLAQGGVLTDTSVTGLDTSAVAGNLLAAGQVGGRTYGVPIGANTLALYYNKGDR